MQHEESCHAADECRMAGPVVWAESSGDDFEDPARNGDGVEKKSLFLAVHSPVQFERQQVLRIRADFLHFFIFVANPRSL